LELGAVHTLIIFENLDMSRIVLKNQAGGKFSVVYQILTY
jgi:peptide subunit release factor 1 (eRF1)